MTQAPLLNAQENLRKNESDITAALDQLHKEYQSVKTLLDRYSTNTMFMMYLCKLLVWPGQLDSSPLPIYILRCNAESVSNANIQCTSYMSNIIIIIIKQA